MKVFQKEEISGDGEGETNNSSRRKESWVKA